MRRKNILIYEGWYQGHQKQYILGLVDFLKNHPPLNNNFHFLLHPNLKDDIITNLHHTNINIHFIPNKNLVDNYRKTSHVLKVGWLEWKFISQKVKDLAITDILFMNIETFFLVMPLKIPKNIRCSVIYFQPFCRLPNTNIFNRNFWKKKWRYLLVILLLKSKSLSKILILNDHKAVEYLNDVFKHKPVFEYLCDPIYPIVKYDETFKLRKVYQIKDNQIIYTIFGLIRPRKNIENILAAIVCLKAEIANKITLLIIGQCSIEYQRFLTIKIKEIKEINPSLNIIFQSQFQSQERVNTIIRDSDVILIPYLDFYYSSGVLGKAAYEGKLVIGSRNTLIGELIIQYNLGFNVNPMNPMEIRRIIEESIDISSNHKMNHQFIAASRPQLFAQTLFEEYL